MMKHMMIAAFVLLAAGAYAAVVVTAAPTYNLTPVSSYEDAVACGKAGGRGALVFQLNAEGVPASEQEAFCVLSVK